MIKIADITKFYTNKYIKTFVLRDIHLEVPEGEFLTVMGPSGAGKTTLLNIIGMLDLPSEGTYYFHEHAVHQLKEKERTGLQHQNIGYIFQSFNLIEELTVYENIETPLLYKKVKSAERKALVAEYLDRFHMVAKKDLFPSQLSGGQQQLAAIARALIIRPRLILADEPTGNLNSTQGIEIMELLKRMNEESGTTIVQVTHSDEKAAYGDRTIHLKDGWIENSSYGDTNCQPSFMEEKKKEIS